MQNGRISPTLSLHNDKVIFIFHSDFDLLSWLTLLAVMGCYAEDDLPAMRLTCKAPVAAGKVKAPKCQVVDWAGKLAYPPSKFPLLCRMRRSMFVLLA
jgi:hypothetical protein